jgi:hypothetical protein
MVAANKKAVPRREYLHASLNTPIEMGASSYWISSEQRLSLDGRDVLFLVRDTDCITSCCGQSQGFRSIGVVGHVIEWHAGRRDGVPVSIVEPIVDEADRERITRLLQQLYKVTQVEFL